MKTHFLTLLIWGLASLSHVEAGPMEDAEKLFRLQKESEGRLLISKFLTSNDNVKSYMDVGTLFFRIKMWDDAIHYLEIATGRDEKSFSAWYRLGLAYHQGKKIDEAVQSLRRAIKAGPKNKLGYLALGEVLELSRNRFDARSNYISYNRRFGSSAEILGRLCVLDFQDYFLKDAVKTCQKVIKMNPKDPVPGAILGRVFYELDKKKAGFESFGRVIKTFPRHPLAYKGRGIIYFNENSFEQAVLDLGKAFGLDRQDEEAGIYLARSLYNIQRYEEALYVYRETCLINKTVRFEFASKQRELDRKGKTELAKMYLETLDEF